MECVLYEALCNSYKDFSHQESLPCTLSTGQVLATQHVCMYTRGKPAWSPGK